MRSHMCALPVRHVEAGAAGDVALGRDVVAGARRGARRRRSRRPCPRTRGRASAAGRSGAATTRPSGGCAGRCRRRSRPRPRRAPRRPPARARAPRRGAAPAPTAGFRSASIVRPRRNHADPGSALRVATDATPRSAATLDVTPMKRYLHGRNLLCAGRRLRRAGDRARAHPGQRDRVRRARRPRRPFPPRRRRRRPANHPGASEGTGRGRHQRSVQRHPAAAERTRQPQGEGDDDRVRRPAVPLLPPVRSSTRSRRSSRSTSARAR